MNTKSWLALAVFLLIVGFAAAISASEHDPRLPSTIPNPRKEFNSWVSNPDNILSQHTIQEIDKRIDEMRKQYQFEIGVAVINRMQVQTIPKMELESYTREVFNNWGIGDKVRKDGILFFISMGDRVNRIQTGKGAREVLTDSFASSILEKAKTPLRAGSHDEAVLQVVGHIVDVIEGKYDTWGRWFLENAFVIGIATVFGIAIAAIAYNGVRTKRRQGEFEEKVKKLQKLKRDQRLHASGSDVCGICLEDFSTKENPKLKTTNHVQLYCNHQFHETCIKDWLKIKNQCPICRRLNPLDERPPKQAPQQPQPPRDSSSSASSSSSFPSTPSYNDSDSCSSSSSFTYQPAQSVFTADDQLFILATMYSDVSSDYRFDSDMNYTYVPPPPSSSSSSFGGGDSNDGGGSSSDW